MLQKILLGLALFLAFGESTKAMNSIDTFIRDRCGARCNGESDDCEVCYNEGVDLFDQTIDRHNSQGRIEFSF